MSIFVVFLKYFLKHFIYNALKLELEKSQTCSSAQSSFPYLFLSLSFSFLLPLLSLLLISLFSAAVFAQISQFSKHSQLQKLKCSPLKTCAQQQNLTKLEATQRKSLSATLVKFQWLPVGNRNRNRNINSTTTKTNDVEAEGVGVGREREGEGRRRRERKSARKLVALPTLIPLSDLCRPPLVI